MSAALKIMLDSSSSSSEIDEQEPIKDPEMAMEKPGVDRKGQTKQTLPFKNLKRKLVTEHQTSKKLKQINLEDSSSSSQCEDNLNVVAETVTKLGEKSKNPDNNPEKNLEISNDPISDILEPKIKEIKEFIKLSNNNHKARELKVLDPDELQKIPKSSAKTKKHPKLSKNNCQLSDVLAATNLNLEKSSNLSNNKISMVHCTSGVDKKLSGGNLLAQRAGEFLEMVEDQVEEAPRKPLKKSKKKRKSRKITEDTDSFDELMEDNPEPEVTTSPNPPQIKKENIIVNAKNIHHYPELKKYHEQRYRFFSKYDQGIKLDYDMWFSVTPECIAKHVAQQCGKAYYKEELTIIDAFCGAGGNAIQFAALNKKVKVTAIDIDEKRLELCKHNAKVYGVLDQITFIHGDFMEISKILKNHDICFLSPPWGGPEYTGQDIFKLSFMPIDYLKMFEEASRLSSSVVHFVPKNSDSGDCLRLCGFFEVKKVKFEKQFFGRKYKTLCCYYGKMAGI